MKKINVCGFYFEAFLWNISIILFGEGTRPLQKSRPLFKTAHREQIKVKEINKARNEKKKKCQRKACLKRLLSALTNCIIGRVCFGLRKKSLSLKKEVKGRLATIVKVISLSPFSTTWEYVWRFTGKKRNHFLILSILSHPYFVIIAILLNKCTSL